MARPQYRPNFNSCGAAAAESAGDAEKAKREATAFAKLLGEQAEAEAQRLRGAQKGFDGLDGGFAVLTCA